MESAVAFGRLIKERRKALGLSQKAFAESMHYHRTEISMIERGARDIRLEMICQLARGLRTTPSELLDGLDLNTLAPRRGASESTGQSTR